MYQEYAIDPTTICQSADRFLRFWGGLGYGEGRLLSKFPGKWERMLLRSESYGGLTDIQKTAILQRLATEKETKQRIIPSGRNYNSNSTDWLEAAESGHSEKPFHAILAEENPRNHGAVSCFDNVGKDGDCWTVSRPWLIERWHTDLAKVAVPLLRVSREILLIDPNFQFKERFTRPLKAFLSELLPYAGVIRRIELHLNYNNRDLSHQTFRDEFLGDAKNNLRHCCPTGGQELLKKLDFFIWERPESNRMHPRYILTEVAGLKFDYGLDESIAGHELTDVDLVSGHSLQGRWKEFQIETSPRPLIHRIRFEEWDS
jgi:hypothetical protein